MQFLGCLRMLWVELWIELWCLLRASHYPDQWCICGIQGQIHNFLLPGLLGNGNSSRDEKLATKIFRGQTLVSDSYGMVWDIYLEVHYILCQPKHCCPNALTERAFHEAGVIDISPKPSSGLCLTQRPGLYSADWIHAAPGSRKGPACHCARLQSITRWFVRINTMTFSNKCRGEAGQLTTKMEVQVSVLFLGGPCSFKGFPLSLLQREQ